MFVVLSINANIRAIMVIPRFIKPTLNPIRLTFVGIVSISSDKSIPTTSIPISAKYSLTEPVPQARSKTELQFAQFSLKKS